MNGQIHAAQRTALAVTLATLVGCSSGPPSGTPSAKVVAPSLFALASLAPASIAPTIPPCPSGSRVPPGRYFLPPEMSETTAAFTIELPSGWDGCGLFFKENPSPGGLMMVGFWTTRNVYRDSCHWRQSLPDAPLGNTVDDLITAIAAQDPGVAGPPSEVTIDGYNGRYVRFEVAPDLDTTACDRVDIAEFRFWNGPGESVWWLGAADAPGLIGEVWTVDLDGTRFDIQAASYADAPDPVRDEIHAIVESIDFCLNPNDACRTPES